jgi:hypothetical protein
MDMDSISALLEALKRGDAGKGLDLPDDDSGAKPIAAKISILKAMPLGKGDDDDDEHALDLHGMDDGGMDDVMPDKLAGLSEMHDDSDAGQDAHDNEQIVSALQTMFPEIYAKICKTVLGDDGSDDMGSIR